MPNYMMTKEATENFIEIVKYTSDVWGNEAVDKSLMRLSQYSIVLVKIL